MTASTSGTAPRQRPYHPRTRNGCITCKIRRVKCGEEKPNCLRCTSTGRKCDGYLQVPPAHSRSSKERSVTPTSNTSRAETPTSLALVLPPSAHFPAEGQERRCFHYFRTRTVPQLSDFFKSEFWDRILLQAVHHEPSLRHGVIALGSLHERFEAGDSSVLRSNQDVNEGGFALEQYSLAIRHLVNPPSDNKPAVDVCLAGCILFASFETLRGHFRSSFTHVNSGLKILKDLESNQKSSYAFQDALLNSPCPYIPLKELKSLFTRMDTQVIQMISTNSWKMIGVTPEVSWRPSPFGEGVDLQIPPVFSCLEDARDAIDLYTNRFIRSLTAVENPTSPAAAVERAIVRDTFGSLLDRWSSAYEAFVLAANKTFNATQLRGALLLNLLHRLCRVHFVIIDTSNLFDEMIWDEYMTHFQECVSLAEAIAEPLPDSPNSNSSKRTPTFTIDSGIVGPMFQVATKCRDPHIRRRAIALLYSAGRQEGIWNGPIIARVSERMMHMEEEGLETVESCKDVPDEARLSGVEPHFNMEGRRALLKYKKGVDGMGDDAGWNVGEEIIEW